jgi:hypothetical protein
MADLPPSADRTGATAPGEVIAPDGVDEPAGGPAESPAESVESPTKIIRIGSMVKQLLDEVRSTTMDEAARDRLRGIYENSVSELRTALSPELSEELDRLAPDFGGDDVPSDGELRVAQAQLVGWLEGLFHGIQATLMTQQMAARQQLEGMRAQLQPPGMGGRSSATPPGGPGYI